MYSAKRTAAKDEDARRGVDCVEAKKKMKGVQLVVYS